VIEPENVMSRAKPSPIIVIFCVGLMAEFILPWAVIWLSDMFFFDIPGWSLWLLFGAPPGAQPSRHANPLGSCGPGYSSRFVHGVICKGSSPTFAVSRATPVIFAQIVKRLLTERNFAAVSWSWRLAKTWARGRSDRALGSEFSHQPGPVPTARPPTAKAA
jgi:hypothetical protein